MRPADKTKDEMYYDVINIPQSYNGRVSRRTQQVLAFGKVQMQKHNLRCVERVS